MDVKLENIYCCCCFNNTNLFNMLYPCDGNGTSEIYSNMISECFGLEIKINIGDEHKNLCVICADCIVILRSASYFRRQVENAYNRIRDIVLGRVSPSVKCDPDEISNMDSDIDCVEIEPKNFDNFNEGYLDNPSKNVHIKISDRELITDKITNAEDRIESVTESDTKPLLINKAGGVQKRKPKKKSNVKNVTNSNNSNIHKRMFKATEYTCDICQKTIKWKSNLRNHMQLHQITTEHSDPCEVCGKTFKIERYLREHMKLRHGTTESTEYPCEVCGKSFKSKKSLKAHLKRHVANFNFLMENNIDPIDLKNINCGVCGEKFNHIKALKHHMGAHFPKGICHICSKPFISLRNLQNHIKSHEETVYTCDICKKIHKKESSYKAHLLTHRKNFKKYKFKCNHCPEEFDYYHQKAVHTVKVHNDRSKMVQCKHCDKMFCTNGKLSAHVRAVHKKIKNYQCDLCKMEFFSRNGLINHMPFHTGRRDFHCNKCKSSFKMRPSLQRHMKICKR